MHTAPDPSDISFVWSLYQYPYSGPGTNRQDTIILLTQAQWGLPTDTPYFLKLHWLQHTHGHAGLGSQGHTPAQLRTTGSPRAEQKGGAQQGRIAQNIHRPRSVPGNRGNSSIPDATTLRAPPGQTRGCQIPIGYSWVRNPGSRTL